MRRILMSGAGGFIGRRLAAVLQGQGAHVATIGRGAGSGTLHFACGSAPWSVAQWRRALSLAEPEIVFHLAGAREGSPEELEDINVGLARGLLSAVEEMRTFPTLVFAGSAAEYGAAAADGVAVREDATCAPLGAYGKTKLAQTSAAIAFAERTGARVLVPRIFNPIGPGMPAHLALADFARQIVRLGPEGGWLETGDIDVSRDFVDIGQVTSLLATLAFNSTARGVVNLCTGIPTPLRYLVETMIAVSGKPIRVRVDQSRSRQGDPRIVFGSVERLKALVGDLRPADWPAVCAAILDAEAMRGEEGSSRVQHLSENRAFNVMV
jgi:GDP-4-dehydro-6-deoxy-D-mannose reductase